VNPESAVPPPPSVTPEVAGLWGRNCAVPPSLMRSSRSKRWRRRRRHQSAPKARLLGKPCPISKGIVVPRLVCIRNSLAKQRCAPFIPKRRYRPGKTRSVALRARPGHDLWNNVAPARKPSRSRPRRQGCSTKRSGIPSSLFFFSSLLALSFPSTMSFSSQATCYSLLGVPGTPLVP